MCTPTHQAVYTCSKTKPGTYEKTLCSFQPDQPDFFNSNFPPASQLSLSQAWATTRTSRFGPSAVRGMREGAGGGSTRHTTPPVPTGEVHSSNSMASARRRWARPADHSEGCGQGPAHPAATRRRPCGMAGDARADGGAPGAPADGTA